MSDDTAERLDALEDAQNAQRRRWVYAAAKTAGLHGADLIADKIIDPKTLVTAADADRAVAAFAAENPNFRREPEPVTLEEAKRQWGAEILARIDASR
jgi:hypothetical protein